MLIKSNETLILLYKLIGGNESKIKQLEAWQEKAISSFNNKLFDEDLGAYIHYDLRNEKPIRLISSSSFTPLFANIPSKERASRLVKTLMSKFGKENQYLCASFDPESELYKPKKYWRGPVWINLNWLIYNGLAQYGFKEISKRVKDDTVELIVKNGFYEYFDARKEISDAGYGGINFSWTASLLLDLLNGEAVNGDFSILNSNLLT
jgi:neutral trehalase